jgi:hypothetical protein
MLGAPLKETSWIFRLTVNMTQHLALNTFDQWKNLGCTLLLRYTAQRPVRDAFLTSRDGNRQFS